MRLNLIVYVCMNPSSGMPRPLYIREEQIFIAQHELQWLYTVEIYRLLRCKGNEPIARESRAAQIMSSKIFDPERYPILVVSCLRSVSTPSDMARTQPV